MGCHRGKITAGWSDRQIEQINADARGIGPDRVLVAPAQRPAAASIVVAANKAAQQAGRYSTHFPATSQRHGRPWRTRVPSSELSRGEDPPGPSGQYDCPRLSDLAVRNHLLPGLDRGLVRADRILALDERLTRQFGLAPAMLIRLREMPAQSLPRSSQLTEYGFWFVRSIPSREQDLQASGEGLETRR